MAANAPGITDAQLGALEKNLRSPYTERWSFGFQRQLPDKILLDVSYVGSVSHKLTTRVEMNPRLLNGRRLHPEFGQRIVRTSEGNSAYHALQWRVDRRFARGFQLAASYTWSRNIDSTSEGVATNSNQSSFTNLTSIPVAQGGLKLDRGLSDYHRAHRLTFVYLALRKNSWECPMVGASGGCSSWRRAARVGVVQWRGGRSPTCPHPVRPRPNGGGVQTVSGDPSIRRISLIGNGLPTPLMA